jgi:hypothetical protein
VKRNVVKYNNHGTSRNFNKERSGRPWTGWCKGLCYQCLIGQTNASETKGSKLRVVPDNKVVMIANCKFNWCINMHCYCWNKGTSYFVEYMCTLFIQLAYWLGESLCQCLFESVLLNIEYLFWCSKN